MCPLTRIIPILLIAGVVSLPGALGEDGPCSPASRDADLSGCLSAVRQVATNTSYFWFGSSYATRCPPALQFTINCASLGLDPTANNTLSSMAFRVPNTDLSGLDRYVDVKFTSEPGTYTGCDNVHTQTDPVVFHVDPVSEATHTPWLLRARPEVSWTADPSDLFSMIVIDVGNGFLHGIFVNIPGSDISQADIVKDYHGPRNSREIPNVYAFVVYKQPASINASTVTFDPFSGLNITQFAEQYQLGNPVGLSWMQTAYDAYAINLQSSVGIIQNCASLVANAMTSADHPSRPFLPETPALSVYLRVRFTTSETTFPCGDENRTQEAADFYADPIGSPYIKTAVARTGSTITYMMQMNKLYPNNTVDFVGKMYSLVVVDPDIPTAKAIVGGNERPLLHGLTVNVPGSDVTMGTVVKSYRGPQPPNDLPHYYYFLLYEQKHELMGATTDNYTTTEGCPARIEGRCQFDVNGFVSSNNLTLVGASWVKATNDEFVTCAGTRHTATFTALVFLAALLMALNKM